MELIENEVEKLKRMLVEWYTYPDRELEATFSEASDVTTFLAVAQRLKNKGFTELPQEDKMNIITPERVRFTLTGIGAIESYCRDNTLLGKEFEAMIKDNTGEETNLVLTDYDTKIKIRREKAIEKSDPQINQMFSLWDNQKKAFRIMRRWTFMGRGIRFDLSIIRSTPADVKGRFKWQQRFEDFDLTKVDPKYEIEVELLRPDEQQPELKEGEPNPVLDKVLKDLISGIGEVLRGIQKHTFLIRKSESERAFNVYKKITGFKDPKDSNKFRGNQPITMVKGNMVKDKVDSEPNIRDGYNVTDKADGLRMMGFVDGRGELFMMDMSKKIYKTGLVREACKYSLVDGEFVTRDVNNKYVQMFLLFDIYTAPEEFDVSQMPFITPDTKDGRYIQLQNWISKWNDGVGPQILPGSGVTKKNMIQVSMKEFLFGVKGNNSIFEQCKRVLNASKPYETDGIILTPNNIPLPKNPNAPFKEQFKWKPAKDNTIDFLALINKDEQYDTDLVLDGVKSETGETIRYKVLHLYVGTSADPAFEDPRTTVLEQLPLPDTTKPQFGRKREFKVVRFNPKEFPDTMAHICYREVQTDYGTDEDIIYCENGEPIQNNSIVEMKYMAEREPGWRWVPIRIRHDKTERYQKNLDGSKMNKDESAEGVWNSIHDPITKHMISTGSENPSQEEMEQLRSSGATEISRVYYDRKDMSKDNKVVEGLRAFHRLYIKDLILLGRGLNRYGMTLVDLAVGQGGDVNLWLKRKPSFIFGTDIAGANIRDPESGTYRRYLNTVIKMGGYENVPKMIFTIGSSARIVSTGDAGATPQESDIMRSIYGRVNPQGALPKFVETYGAGRLGQGADCVAIMFALHYFFENESSLQNIIQNISDSLKMGGLFVGCCFDGQRVFDALRRIEEGGSLVGEEKKAQIWKITKRYSSQDFPNDMSSIGMPIDVEFMTIGTPQREYLVNFELLKSKMNEIGCRLLNDDELKQLNLEHSTNTFEESYEMAQKRNFKFDMSKDVKRFSFFNRWFIFKRVRAIGVPEEQVQEQATSSKLDSTIKQQVQAQVQPQVISEVPTNKKKNTKPKVVAEAVSSGEEKKYTLGQLFQFSEDAKTEEGRWLSPIAPFPVTDQNGIEYPSLEHYLAGMKYRVATNQPEIGPSFFSTNGSIHQNRLIKEQTMTAQGTKELSAAAFQELLMEELAEIKAKTTATALKKYGYDEGKWMTMLQDVLYNGLKQRWDRDRRFHDIVESVKTKGQTLLYYTGPKAGSELGGKRTAQGYIDGKNLIGKMIMELAGFKNI